MNLLNLTPKHRAELARRFLAGEFEPVHDGSHILVPRMGLRIGGSFRTTVSAGGEQIDDRIHHNLFTTEGLNDVVSVYFKSGAATATFYLSLFSQNVTPQSTWTGANYNSNATEFVAYTAATRPALVLGTVSAGAVDNSASIANFAINAGSPTNVYGVGLHTVNVKGGTGGKLATASAFDAALPVQNNYTVGIQYALEAEDAG